MILSVTARKERTPKSVVATEIISLMNCSLFALAFQGTFKSHVRILSWRFSKYPDDNAPAGHPGRWQLGFNSFYVA